MTSQSRGQRAACPCIAFEASDDELTCACGHIEEEHGGGREYPGSTACRVGTWSRAEETRTARKKHSRDGVLRCDICSPLRCSKAPR